MLRRSSFGERRVVEVVVGDAGAGCDDVRDAVELPPLLLGEPGSGLGLLGEPAGVPILHDARVGHQLVVDAERQAQQAQ